MFAPITLPTRIQDSLRNQEIELIDTQQSFRIAAKLKAANTGGL
jgi:hypothetical protein